MVDDLLMGGRQKARKRRKQEMDEETRNIMGLRFEPNLFVAFVALRDAMK